MHFGEAGSIDELVRCSREAIAGYSGPAFGSERRNAFRWKRMAGSKLRTSRKPPAAWKQRCSKAKHCSPKRWPIRAASSVSSSSTIRARCSATAA